MSYNSATLREEAEWADKVPGWSPPRPKPQSMRYRPDGGYDVLHPTKGWRRVSVKRIAYR